MKVNTNGFSNLSLIPLQGQEFLEKQRVAGKVVSGTLIMLENLVKSRTEKTLLQLDALAEEFILDNNCSATFKNYKSFPNAVCISVNKQLVHGIPTNYVLQDGDVVKFDLGATTKDGMIADSAITCIFGEAKLDEHTNLLDATEKALFNAISSIKIGARLGVIGESIYKYGRENNLSVVYKYGGHGIDVSSDGIGIPHAAPFISNRSLKDEGIRMVSGFVGAIEPLFVIGQSNKTITDKDGWTVSCDNICSHFEHTFFILDDAVEILTYRENEKYLQSNKLYFN